MRNERKFDRRTIGTTFQPFGSPTKHVGEDWQRALEEYNRRLRELGDDDSSAEHTRVAVRQSAGRLERVVFYCEEAFTHGRDYPASSSGDDEDDMIFVSPTFFVSQFFLSGIGTKTGHFRIGLFFSPFAQTGSCAEKKIEKRRSFQRNHRLKQRSKVRVNMTDTASRNRKN